MNVTPLNALFDTPLQGLAVSLPRPVASVLIVHGIGEHMGRYEAMLQALCERNLAGLAYDQRGHGHSPGARTHIESFERLTQDLCAVINGVVRTRPAKPLFVWGHSLGSLVTLVAAPGFAHQVRGVVTTGCPVAVCSRLSPVLLPLVRAVARMTPTLRVPSVVGASELSHDDEVRRAYDADPLVVHSATLSLITEIGQAIREGLRLAPSLRIPWLAMHGTEDKISPPEGSRELIELLGSDDKTLYMLEGARHELHNEVPPLRTQFFETMTRWLLDRSPPLE